MLRSLKISRMPALAGMSVLMTVLAFPAFAQQDTQSRINRLENEIQTLSRAVFKGEQPPPGAFQDTAGAATQAQTDSRLSQMEEDLRALTGRVEQIDYDNRRFQEGEEKVLKSLELRLSDMEARMGGVEPQPAPMEKTGLNTTMHLTAPPAEMPLAVVNNNPDAPAPANAPTVGEIGTLHSAPVPEAADSTGLYEQAFAMLQDRDYDGAERSFTAFLKRYPDDKLSGNAKYWLGETFYVRGNFERAARVFAEAYQQFPKGPKGPDNLLKLALSLNGMGKKDDACLTLAQLRREYPSGAGPVLARADQEATAMGCPATDQ